MSSERNRLEAPSFKFRRKRSKPREDDSEAPEAVEEGESSTDESVETSEPPAPSETADDTAITADDPEPTAEQPVYEAPAPPLEPEPEDDEDKDGQPDTAAKPSAGQALRSRLDLRLPGPVTAALIGLGVGLFIVLAIAGVEQLSQSLRGTSSLGRIGIPLLIAVFAVAVFLSTYALKAVAVPSPATTAFLGTGLVVVIAMFFFPASIGTLGGGIAIMVIATLTFVLSRWVSVTYLD